MLLIIPRTVRKNVNQYILGIFLVQNHFMRQFSCNVPPIQTCWNYLYTGIIMFMNCSAINSQPDWYIHHTSIACFLLGSTDNKPLQATGTIFIFSSFQILQSL